MKIFSMFSPRRSFIALSLKHKPLIYFEYVFIICGIRVQFHSLACGYPVFLTWFVDETIFFSLCIPDILVEDYMTLNVFVFILEFSVLFCWSVSLSLGQFHTDLITVAL